MKKIVASILCLMLLAVSSIDASAVQRHKRSSRSEYSTRDRRYNDRYNDRYRDSRYEDYDGYRDRDESIWDRSRDKITTAAGAAGGAAIGAAIGGNKGAIIGAIVGGAGSALYTYKIRKKDERRRY